LILVACAGLVVALGMRVGPSKWLPFMLGGAARADRISSFSLVSGIVMVVFGVLGCIGALKRMKPCLYLFGLLVLTLMAAAAGCLLLGAEAKSAVAEWRDASYRLDNLTAPALETLGTLHSQWASLVTYCAPRNGTGLLTALESAPPLPAFSCAEAEMAEFGSWVSSECLAPQTTVDAIRACRTDLLRSSDFSSRYATSDALFCTCGGALASAVHGRLWSALVCACVALLIYLLFVLCVLCGACKQAAKATKRKKKAKFERQIQAAAEREASVPSTN